MPRAGKKLDMQRATSTWRPTEPKRSTISEFQQEALEAQTELNALEREEHEARVSQGAACTAPDREQRVADANARGCWNNIPNSSLWQDVCSPSSGRCPWHASVGKDATSEEVPRCILA